MSTIKKIVDNIFRIPGKASLEDIYQAAGDKLLPVEPFSKKQTIADFILEGGTGYNSMLYGSLGEHIYEIKASYNGKPFTYGLPFSTLYATGYPMQRIIEGSRTNALIKPFDRIDYVTVPLLDSKDLKVFTKQSAFGPFDLPAFTINAVFLNATASKLLGADHEGFFVTLPGDTETAEGWAPVETAVWDNRFFMDTLDDAATLTVFTQKSTSLSLNATCKERKVSGLFVALFTKKGILVKVTGTADEMDGLWESIKEQAHTYRLG
jgi:hypothetical protein